MVYFFMFVKLLVSQIVLANELLFLANNGFYGTAHECSNFTPLQLKMHKKEFQSLMINLCVILLGSKTQVVSNKSIVFQF